MLVSIVIVVSMFIALRSDMANVRYSHAESTPLVTNSVKPNAGSEKPGVQKGDTERKTNNEKCEPAKIESAGCSASVEAPHTNGKQTDPYDPRHDPLYRAYLWFTIGGVLVGLGGNLRYLSSN